MIVTVYSNDNSIDWGAKGEARIIQNVRNILRTKTFEVPFMRDLGISQDYIDVTVKGYDISTPIRAVINKYEPRANVLSARVISFDENGDAVIVVDLEV